MISGEPNGTPQAQNNPTVLRAELAALSRALEELWKRRVGLAKEYRLLVAGADATDAWWQSACEERARGLDELEGRIRQYGVKRIEALYALRELRMGGPDEALTPERVANSVTPWTC